MSKKNRHKNSNLLKKLNMSASAPTAKNSVAKPENYYAEDYRGYKITVVEITDDEDGFKGSLEVEVDNDENDETWHYMPFEKDELENQLAICRREIDADYELTLEIRREAEDEEELESA